APVLCRCRSRARRRGHSDAWRFVKTAFDERTECGYRGLLVGSVRRDDDFASPGSGEQQKSHDALAVNLPPSSSDADAAGKSAGGGHETSGGARVQPQRIENRDGRACHAFSPFSRSEATQMAFRPCSLMSRASAARSAGFCGRASLISIARFTPVMTSTCLLTNVTPELAGVPPNMSVKTRTSAGPAVGPPPAPHTP